MLRRMDDVGEFDCLLKHSINDDERQGVNGRSRVPSTQPFLPPGGKVPNAPARS